MPAWSSVGSGAYVPHLGAPAAGVYIQPPSMTESSFAFSDGDARPVPILVPADVTVDRIACEVVSAGTTGSVIRMGIYENANFAPSNLVLDAGTVSGETTGIKTITISQTLSAGWHWLVAVNQGGASTRASLRYSTDLAVPILSGGTSPVFNTGGGYASVAGSMTGALADPFVVTGRQQGPPLVALRIA